MTHQLLVDAINNRRVLYLFYGGHLRTVEPHAYGLSRAGNPVLRCYQTSGGSRSGGIPDWRLMALSDISDVRETGDMFSSARPGYRRGDKGMTHIYAQL